jgi:nucleoid-associated protein YgaU
LLVPVTETRDYWLKGVSFPVARPALKLFIDRLASQYRAACGERLVVTSLTRPLANQPRNASRRSVHPTGMALDLRRPYPGPCRDWLEDTLLYLEGQKVLEATRESSPAHYHIALFPQPYVAHVSRITGLSTAAIAESIMVDGEPTTYTVKRRDTLWQISRRYDTTPRAIRLANGLSSSNIYPGQQLKIPSSSR